MEMVNEKVMDIIINCKIPVSLVAPPSPSE